VLRGGGRAAPATAGARFNLEWVIEVVVRVAWYTGHGKRGIAYAETAQKQGGPRRR